MLAIPTWLIDPADLRTLADNWFGALTDKDAHPASSSDWLDFYLFTAKLGFVDYIHPNLPEYK